MAESIDALNKKVDRLLEGVDLTPLQGCSDEDVMSYMFEGDVSFFSREERQAILSRIAAIQPRVTYTCNGNYDFMIALTDAELETFYHYQQLLKALQRGDEAEAQTYRELLRTR